MAEKFKNRRGFVLASIGAAVGLGNALRFPGLCARFGGAYILVYFVALVTLGIPILNAELALGRRAGGGAPACLEGLKRGGARVGWAACANSVFTAFIYAGLAGWILSAAIVSPKIAQSAGEMSDTKISSYFFDNVLNARWDGVISGISPLVLLCIAAAVAVMYLCLRGGARSLARAAEVTVIVPAAMLLLMAGRGLIYENSGKALAALFLPDFKSLLNPSLWISALSQVFFSLSVGVGIMPAFGAYLPERTAIFPCSLIIAGADFFVSVLASVALFCTLYGCGLQSRIFESGIITAFVVYPVAISRLFGRIRWLNAACGIIFYGSLFLLAVQSAVSMLEAFLSPFSQTFGIKKKKAAGIFCLVGAAVCVIFATTAAPLIVEISDKFVNFYNVLALEIAECLIIGRSGACEELAGECSRFGRRLKMPKKAMKISIKYLSPAVLLCLSATEVLGLILFGTGYPAWAQIAFGWGLSAAVIAAGALLRSEILLRKVKCADGA